MTRPTVVELQNVMDMTDISVWKNWQVGENTLVMLDLSSNLSVQLVAICMLFLGVKFESLTTLNSWQKIVKTWIRNISQCSFESLWLGNLICQLTELFVCPLEICIFWSFIKGNFWSVDLSEMLFHASFHFKSFQSERIL